MSIMDWLSIAGPVLAGIAALSWQISARFTRLEERFDAAQQRLERVEHTSGGIDDVLRQHGERLTSLEQSRRDQRAHELAGQT